MSRVLKGDALSQFIAHFVPPQAYSLDTLIKLSFINNRICQSIQNSLRLTRISLSLGGNETTFEVFFEHRIWKCEPKSIYINIYGYNKLVLTLISMHCLTKSRDSLEASITLHPNGRTFHFLDNKVAYQLGRTIRELLPYAKIKLEAQTGYTRRTMIIGRVFCEEIASLLTSFESPATDVLSICDASNLDKLFVIRYGMFLKPKFYAPLVFQIGAKNLWCETWLYLHHFCYARFPIQPLTEKMVCGINLEVDKHKDLYPNVFNEIKESLPNLNEITMFRGRVEVDKPFRHIPRDHRYQLAIESMSWHINQIANNSHVITKLDIKFPLYRTDDAAGVGAVLEIFLPGLTEIDEEKKSAFTVKTFVFSSNYTTVKIELQKYN
ncbi:unnamed protein product [Bursaphelenchus xylophilus]|uniref:(pine wood nematode) hypothetical protein n=1 Tax=Bursaphelenchus xylophilus TaxID=6326 RepID=A0A1I7SV07_BURXY|nr:unnamed protein product [Bursaphelenchus xylophilus]CAG9100700.1 unnamed protein product [Bursaphelenchus xylophilus]